MEYDLIIIGGGAAAFAAAHRAERMQKKTLIINDGNILPLGGTCVNVGCIPSKIMLHQGSLLYQAMKNRFRALSLSGGGDFVDALSETREMVKGFQEKNYINVIQAQEYVDFHEGHARLKDPHTVVTARAEFTGRYILIATGASTFVPPVEGIAEIDYLTNRTVFDLTEKPESIIILGGGPEAMEFAQIFHRFGIKTTVIQRSNRILTKFDNMIANKLHEYLADEGIRIITDTKLLRAEEKNGRIEITFEKKGEGIKSAKAEKVLVATGLRGNTDTLSVENAGVERDEKGFVKVTGSLRTSQPHIYAAGDVTGIMPLETVAAKQGSLAVQNMFGETKKTIDYNVVPRAVFTSPEVASVGLTEEEYMKKYNVCLCRTISFDHLERAALMKETRGIIRMVVHPETKEVVGVHLVGPHASEIITTATYAIRNRMTIYDIRDTAHVFPTLSEAIKKVAQSFDEDLGKMACCVE
ncbi:MAG: mercury(II) reductase [Nitrospirae bacterium]|nr:mercury(II) reductase [Nitrospirota bacterium]